MDGKYIDSYDSLAEAQDKTGVNSTNISKCINKVQKSAGNYKWMKEDDYNKFTNL